MSTDPSIRNAARADLEAMDRLQGQVHKLRWGLAIWRELWASDETIFWIIDTPQQGGVAAYLVAWRCLDAVEICDLVVAPSYRRRGLGRWLIRTLAAIAATTAVNWIAVEARAEDRNAVDFYRGLGFQYQGRESAFYADGEDAEKLVLPLVDC